VEIRLINPPPQIVRGNLRKPLILCRGRCWSALPHSPCMRSPSALCSGLFGQGLRELSGCALSPKFLSAGLPHKKKRGLGSLCAQWYPGGQLHLAR